MKHEFQNSTDATANIWGEHFFVTEQKCATHVNMLGKYVEGMSRMRNEWCVQIDYGRVDWLT